MATRASLRKSHHYRGKRATSTPSSISTASSYKAAMDAPIRAKKKRNVRKGKCYNCGCDETETDLWRSDIFAPPTVKQMVCNACGLWSRDHGEYRPPHMFKHLKTRLEKKIQDEKNKEAIKKAMARGAAAAVARVTPMTSHSSSCASTPCMVPTPLSFHSGIITHSPPPHFPSPQAATPPSDYFAPPRRRDHTEDVVAAGTLMSMLNGPNFHEAPPPLGRTEAHASLDDTLSNGRRTRFPLSLPLDKSHHHNLHDARDHHRYSGQHHSHSYPQPSVSPVPAGPPPPCHLFERAATSRYVPSWMDGQRPLVVPTTPTQAHYGRRRNSDPSPDGSLATPTASTTFMERTNSTPTYVRPSLANLCHTPSSSSPKSVHLPPINALDSGRHYPASQASSSSAHVSREFGHAHDRRSSHYTRSVDRSPPAQYAPPAYDRPFLPHPSGSSEGSYPSLVHDRGRRGSSASHASLGSYGSYPSSRSSGSFAVLRSPSQEALPLGQQGPIYIRDRDDVHIPDMEHLHLK